MCDASALVALLLDAGPDGHWSAEAVSGADLVAPALLAFETANVLRRHELAGRVSSDQAAQAHADLLELAIEYWPYEPLAARAWELRHNMSAYDACYVALAELLETTLVTLDRRMSRVESLRCAITTP